jgi:hypothetical protein
LNILASKYIFSIATNTGCSCAYTPFKISIYIWLAVLCASETWFLTLTEVCKIRVLEKIMKGTEKGIRWYSLKMLIEIAARKVYEHQKILKKKLNEWYEATEKIIL